MLNYEQKVLLSLCRNDDDYKHIVKYIDIDFDLLMKYSIDHRLFINIYDKLLNIIPQSLKTGYTIFYNSIIKTKQLYTNFFNYVIELLNKKNYNYVVLKGLATEMQIYNSLYSRMYSDLDLLVYEDQFNEIIDYICSCFSLNKADNIGDYYRHEIKITVFWNGQEYTIEIKRRHRECDYKLTKYFLNNKKFIIFNNLSFPVLTNEALFISLSLYLYNYNERIYSWIFSKKIRLCYFFDLYSFMINQNINFDSVINICCENNILYKIILVLENLNKLFVNKIVNDTLQFFKKRYENDENSEHNDLYCKGRVNWNIGIIDRVFNYSKVAELIQSMCSGEFLIGEANKNIYKGQTFSLYNKNSKLFDIYNVKILDYKLLLKFSNLNIPLDGNSLVYIKLYLYDIYGEFSFPYIPISIRFDKNVIHTYNRFTVDSSNFTYKYENEKMLPYQNDKIIIASKVEEKLDVAIDLKAFGYDEKVNKKIGFSIEFIRIINGKTYVVDRINDDDDFPYWM